MNKTAHQEKISINDFYNFESFLTAFNKVNKKLEGKNLTFEELLKELREEEQNEQ